MVFQINEDLSIHKLKEKVWGVGGGVGGWVGEGVVLARELVLLHMKPV